MPSSYAIYDTPGNEVEITSLHEAAEQGNVEALHEYLQAAKQGALEQRDAFGRTPLMWASESGRPEAVQLLLQSGAKVHAKEEETGRAAVHLAARCGCEASVRALVDRGADVHTPDNYGLTPLFLALQKGWVLDERKWTFGSGAPRVLMEHGAKYINSPNKTDTRGQGKLAGLTPEEEYAATGVRPETVGSTEGASCKMEGESMMVLGSAEHSFALSVENAREGGSSESEMESEDVPSAAPFVVNITTAA